MEDEAHEGNQARGAWPVHLADRAEAHHILKRDAGGLAAAQFSSRAAATARPDLQGFV